MRHKNHKFYLITLYKDHFELKVNYAYKSNTLTSTNKVNLSLALSLVFVLLIILVNAKI